MNLARAESSRRAAQSSYDAQFPDYETDADEAVRHWLEACPVALSELNELRVKEIVIADRDDAGNWL